MHDSVVVYVVLMKAFTVCTHNTLYVRNTIVGSLTHDFA